jgi:hypothetical protein
MSNTGWQGGRALGNRQDVSEVAPRKSTPPASEMGQRHRAMKLGIRLEQVGATIKSAKWDSVTARRAVSQVHPCHTSWR